MGTLSTIARRSSFEALRKLRAFEKHNLPFLRTCEDRELACEVGYRQAVGRPLTIKEAFLLDIGSVATVQRQLRRLRHDGAIAQVRSKEDARVVNLTLTPRASRAFAAYGRLINRR
jgi:hypothetical protein